MAASTERPPARPLIYAHRGSSHRYPELTRAAYVQAIADGADGVECDVHLTRDGHLVLHHDAQLGRTSNGSGPVAQHTLAQLRELDFTSWKGVEIPPSHGAAHEQLLTLDELLDLLLAAGRPMGLAVETKHPSPYGHGLEEALLVLLMRRGWNPETGMLGTVTVSIMSFHPDAVRHVLDHVPPRHVCQLVSQSTVESVRAGLGVGTATAAVCRAGMRLVMPPGVPSSPVGRWSSRGRGSGSCGTTPGWWSSGSSAEPCCGCGRWTPSRTPTCAWPWGSSRSPPTCPRSSAAGAPSTSTLRRTPRRTAEAFGSVNWFRRLRGRRSPRAVPPARCTRPGSGR